MTTHAPLRFLVTDLVGRSGFHRDVTAEAPVAISLAQAHVEGLAEVSARLEAVSQGVLARVTAGAVARVVCIRCLLEWELPVTVEVTQLYQHEPDEDGYRLEAGDWLDLEPLVHDELSLALPTAPLCQEDCKGLCPTCGTDLNIHPCAGHGDEPDSPFAALKQLFDPQS